MCVYVHVHACAAEWWQRVERVAFAGTTMALLLSLLWVARDYLLQACRKQGRGYSQQETDLLRAGELFKIYTHIKIDSRFDCFYGQSPVGVMENWLLA